MLIDKIKENVYNIGKDKWFWRIVVISMILILFVIVEIVCSQYDNEFMVTRNNNLNKHLYYIINKFNAHKITYWLMYDTLLSGIRINNISNIITDLDIGVHMNDIGRIMSLNEIIKHDGYFIRKLYVYAININDNSNKLMWKCSLKISYTGTDICNVICFEKFKDKIMRRYDIKTDINFLPSISTFPEWFIEELEDIIINDAKYKIPRRSDILLEYWYGSKWKSINLIDVYDDTNYMEPSILKLSLSSLINNVNKITNKLLVVKNNRAKYTYPESQIEWIKNNDPIL